MDAVGRVKARCSRDNFEIVFGLMYRPPKIPDDAKRLTIVAIGPQSLKFLALRLETVQQAIAFPTPIPKRVKFLQVFREGCCG